MQRASAPAIYGGLSPCWEAAGSRGIEPPLSRFASSGGNRLEGELER